MFSKACEYAIKIMIFIAANEEIGKRTSLKDVTEAIDSPGAFTAKILQRLAKEKLLKSYRGPNGGFVLEDTKDITLYNVVAAIDGDHLLEDCVLGLEECSSKNPCPVHNKFLNVKTQLNETLLTTKVKDGELLQGSYYLRN